MRRTVGADAKKTPIDERELAKLVNKKIKVFLVNGTGFSGTLIEHDARCLIISPWSILYLDKVTTFYEDTGRAQTRKKPTLRRQ